MMSRKTILGAVAGIVGIALAGSASAAPITLEGMGIVTQWTDLEDQTDDMPSFIWGTSDATNEDRIGLHVLFANGLEGSVTYSGLSGLWNSFGHSIAPDTVTGFFATAQNTTHLFNVPSTTTNYPDALPIAWSGFVMDFSNNFDLDYNDQNGSNFRASVPGWESAVFTTYSSAVGAVPEPTTLALLGLGFAGLGIVRRRKN